MFCSSWYGDAPVTLEFPEGWDIEVNSPRATPSLSDKEVVEAFNSPIGTNKISELARGKRDAVIVVDDLTRPTPAFKIMPSIIKELRQGGIRKDNIRIVMGVGSHRPLDGRDIRKKLGVNIAESFEVFNHSPYENLTYMGTSKAGTPIYINRIVAESELKIGVGSILPYPAGGAGYGGGAKIIVPAVSGLKTIEHFHSIPGADTGNVESNELRKNMEEIARLVGLDVIVNTVINNRREITGLFIGDMIEAHRKGIELAEKIYNVEKSRDVDIALVNAYPFDTEFLQAGRGVACGFESTRNGGSVIIYGTCYEGRGYHILSQKGFGHWKPPDKERGYHLLSQEGSGYEREKEWNVLIVCPTVSMKEVNWSYPKGTMLFHRWKGALNRLQKIHGTKARVAIYTHGPLSLLP